MHNEYTSVLDWLKSIKLQLKLEQNNIGQLIVFVQRFEIVNALTNSSRSI